MTTEAGLGCAGLLLGDRVVTNTELGVVPHVNPASGKEQGAVTLAGPAEIDAAVRWAREASAEWRRRPHHERRALLLKVADLIAEHYEDLAELTVLENGIPTSFASPEAESLPEYFRYYAGWCEKVDGRVV